jgi:hypothetical protein
MGHLDYLTSNVENALAAHPTLVPTITVDTFVTLSGVLPDLIKMDVEGAEFDVLSGAEDTLRTAKPILFLSVHSGELYDACNRYLTRLNYTLETLTSSDSVSYELMAYSHDI